LISGGKSHVVAGQPCGRKFIADTWNLTSPTGHVFNSTWFGNTCDPRMTHALVNQCLQNTEIVLIGDCTLRHMFHSIRDLVPCEWDGDDFDTGGKHRSASCSHVTSNFSLSWIPHGDPFCVYRMPRHYLRSFRATVNSLQKTNHRRIVVFHVYAHVVNYHSHVFYDIMKDLKSVVEHLLRSHPNTFVAIKGPHAYSFSKSSDHVLWMPDIYAHIHSHFIWDIFRDLKNRIMYLETLDMTVASEQFSIHADKTVIRQQLLRILDFACSDD